MEAGGVLDPVRAAAGDLTPAERVYRQLLREGSALPARSSPAATDVRIIDWVRELAAADGLRVVTMWDRSWFGNVADPVQVVEIASARGDPLDPGDVWRDGQLPAAQGEWGSTLVAAQRRAGVVEKAPVLSVHEARSRLSVLRLARHGELEAAQVFAPDWVGFIPERWRARVEELATVRVGAGCRRGQRGTTLTLSRRVLRAADPELPVRARMLVEEVVPLWPVSHLDQLWDEADWLHRVEGLADAFELLDLFGNGHVGRQAGNAWDVHEDAAAKSVQPWFAKLSERARPFGIPFVCRVVQSVNPANRDYDTWVGVVELRRPDGSSYWSGGLHPADPRFSPLGMTFSRLEIADDWADLQERALARIRDRVRDAIMPPPPRLRCTMCGATATVAEAAASRWRAADEGPLVHVDPIDGSVTPLRVPGLACERCAYTAGAPPLPARVCGCCGQARNERGEAGRWDGTLCRDCARR